MVVEESSSDLIFGGIFQGREKEIRINAENQVCIFEFIQVVCSQNAATAKNT